MKRVIFLTSIFLLFTIGIVNAKKIPVKAKQLPAKFKQEIIDEINYPQFAEDEQLEGEVWIKVCVTAESKVKILDLSSSNQKLGNHVRKQLSNLLVEKSGCEEGDEYYLKVKFDLLIK